VAEATAGGSATFTVPTYAGSGDVTLDEATASGSASFTVPTYSGSGAATLTEATCAGEATFTAPTYTGEGACTLGRATCDGSGAFTPPTYTGTGAATIPRATAAGSATFTEPGEEQGAPTGGTWTITYNGETTSGLQWNATAPQVQAALCALTSLSPDKVAVSGDQWPTNGGAFTLTFMDLTVDPPEVAINPYLLGGDPTITPATTELWGGAQEILDFGWVNSHATTGTFNVRLLGGETEVQLAWNSTASTVAAAVATLWGVSVDVTFDSPPSLDQGGARIQASEAGNQPDLEVSVNNTDDIPAISVASPGSSTEIQTITLTYTVPSYTAAGDCVIQPCTAEGSGTFVVPLYSGSGAATAPRATALGTAQFHVVTRSPIIYYLAS
jgi:hypothetical protein